jgi:hypothetical protein
VILAAIRRMPEIQFDVQSAVMVAFAAMGIHTVDRAAQELEIPATQLTRQLKGLEHLSLQRLLLIRDPRFWVSLLGSIADYVGASLSCDSSHVRRDVMRLLIQLHRFSVSMLKRDQPVSERKRA